MAEVSKWYPIVLNPDPEVDLLFSFAILIRKKSFGTLANFFRTEGNRMV